MDNKMRFTSLFWYLTYVYIPTFIFLMSRSLMKNFDIIFNALFFVVVTVSALSAYYLVNHSFDPVASDKLIGKVIPLQFLLALVFGFILELLMSV